MLASSISPPPFASVPRHVAIIMDGNGRWAEQRGLPRLQGHQAVIFQQPAAGPKKGFQIMVTDSLDHFNGDQFVKFPVQLAVVLI